ncbi:hypothetical protein K469DRAFT_550185 [Zopfia rhizophila CBS 207.26]|uniref:50S ribosomal protein-like protein YmL27 n=1 Tax=Zopfia rhizophila CBS 207.26 TaxID=1314779 RepID=A0A6A6EMQ0_9PEZI|nr:hypothetical protein K469DRAFT_550185 [Zopfia rhizophila CBS 207.26]
MFKPTAPLFRRVRRLALTTKMTNKGFYKGNRVGSTGWISKFGNFHVDWNKVRTYVAPHGLRESILTPFVTKRIEKEKWSGPEGENPMSGKVYLERWKTENGVD